ncbi:hypothetical protein C2E23DRAFT_904599 [Lenzites betulinus]|nr:hypothetical protein C2E23DRAFT_904599 [Lenzites betulinus]
MDPSDIGRYGTLSLMRRLPVESVVTSYPIDDEELTIGRDQSCSLRLYYPAVSALHAKITFVERKAFLVVLGTNGLLLDDEPLFPATANAPGPTTVPLQNSSVIEIHKKRFRFSYPPKHLRTALINTPTRATPSRRPLRLSMIASAHVFTPGPSENPQVNLRILQSPLRTPFAREQEEIVLVHSDSPSVIEEDKDLVILDEYEPEPEPILPLPLPLAAHPPRTPVRRQMRPSLHRAVLIRSAQRAAIQREMQMEEEHDADEVEETIAAIAEVEEGDDDVQEVPPPGGQGQVSGWRKSLDLVKGGLGWAFRGLSVEPKEEDEDQDLEYDEEQEQQYTEDYDEGMDDLDGSDEDEYEQQEGEERDDYEEDDHHAEPSTPDEPQRPLGQFMTPQLPRMMSAKVGRLSLGGASHDTGPRRVRVVAPWKVGEITVPAPVKEEEASAPPHNMTSDAAAPPATPRSPVKREKLTEEEREAIRARRRSALTTPDNFFKGQTPGTRRTLFPSLAPLPSPSFTQAPATPAAAASSSTAIKDESTSGLLHGEAAKKEDTDEEQDTAVLLARMRQMAESVKQRQSLSRQSLGTSPRKREGGFSLLAPGHAGMGTPVRFVVEEESDDEQPTATAQETAMQTETQNAPVQLQTPPMADLRHVFGRAQAGARTPALAGVRTMFRVQPAGPSETPRMEGVKEMLGTPVGYRAAAPERREEAMTEEAQTSAPQDAEPEKNPEATQEEEKEEAEETVEPLPARGARAKKAPATSRIARRTPAAVPQSAPAKSTRRATSQVPEERPAAEDDRAVRRTRARTADGEVGQLTRATRGKAAEKKPTTPEPQEPEEAPEPAPRTTRRTRQATDSSVASGSSHADDTVDIKPPRKTRAKTPTPAATTTAAPTTTAKRRGTRAKPIEVTEEDTEDDPLDSLPRAGTPAAAASEEAPAPAPAPTRARRGARSKIPVKQEDVEPALPANAEDEATGTRPTRSRRTPVPRQGAAAGSRAGTRARGAATPGADAIPEDKENTPEPGEEDAGFRRTTPGSIYPIIHANKPPPPNQALDPTHPALSYLPADYIRAFPWRTCDGFKLRALPHALLQQPSPRHPSPPYQLHTGPTRGERRVNMSLLNIAPRNIGGHVAREQVFRKFKTAISLIATRGAYVEGSGDTAKVVFGDDNNPFDWILTGWVYVIRPEERVYSMPYQHLIPALRDVLRVTAVTGRRLEKEWAKMKESRCARQSRGTLTLPSSAPPLPSADGEMGATRLLRALREELGSVDDSATSSTKSREQSPWAEIFLRHSTPAPEAPQPGDRDQQRADVEEARSRPRRTAPHGRTRES